MTNSGHHETVLWLLRHPEPDAAVQGRCYGSLDVALSPGGIRQAQLVADSLVKQPFAAIYTSPRQRCSRAAEILAAGRTSRVETVAALRELDFGEWEGRRYDEIAAMYPELYQQWMERPTETQCPGGERFCDMRARVIPATRELRARHEGESIALMTHAGVIRIILANALGMPPANIFRIGQRYAAINVVRYFDESPVVTLVNADSTSFSESAV
jgi:alpha-ribazole phosphatase